MDHNKENVWSRGSKKRKHYDSRNMTSKRASSRRSHFAFPAHINSLCITENRLTSRLGIFNHAIITDSSHSRNKKGVKEKLNSHYFQRDSPGSRHSSSPDEAEIKDSTTRLPSHYLNMDTIATEISHAVESLELTNYINPVKARVQKMFYESCQAYEKLCRDKKYNTPFSEQLTPVAESSQTTQFGNRHERSGQARSHHGADIPHRSTTSLVLQGLTTNPEPELHEMKQPLQEVPAEEMCYNMAYNDYNPFATMETFGDANHFMISATDSNTSHVPCDFMSIDRRPSTQESHCIVNRSIDFLNFLTKEDEIMKEACAESHSEYTITDLEAEKANNSWSRLFEDDEGLPAPRQENFDASSIFLESLKHEKSLLFGDRGSKSSLWELEPHIDIDRLFKSPSPKFSYCQSRRLN